MSKWLFFLSLLALYQQIIISSISVSIWVCLFISTYLKAPQREIKEDSGFKIFLGFSDGSRCEGESGKSDYGGIKRDSGKNISGLDEDDGSTKKVKLIESRYLLEECQGAFGMGWR